VKYFIIIDVIVIASSYRRITKRSKKQKDLIKNIKKKKL